MKAMSAKDIVEDRIDKRVAEPHKKLIWRLIAWHLLQLLQKTPPPFLDRESEPCIKLPENPGSRILVKFDIL